VEAGTVKAFDGDIDAYNEYVLERAGSGNGRRLKEDRGGAGGARQAAPDRDGNLHAAKNAAQLDKRMSVIEERLRKFHDLISRIDQALAEPAVFIEDPAKAVLLSSQRGELERMLVAAEDEWLRLAGDLDAARR
jgi:ATP-binding cassette subfamily F protein 3